MTISSYLTLSDGTLVDFEQDDEGHVLTVRAGRSLDPGERSAVFTLTPVDVQQFGWHLAAFLTKRSVLLSARHAHAQGATHDCGEWGTSTGICSVCSRVL